MKKLSKRILWIVVCAGLLALLVLAFLPKPIPVDTVRVSRGTVQATLEAEGVTRVRDRYVVAAPVTGQVERITLVEGQLVQRDAPVAVILPPELDPLARRELEGRIAAAAAGLRQANAVASRVQAGLEQARRDRDRLRQMEGSGSLSRQDLERAENAVTLGERELAAAQYQAQTAASQLAIARAGRGAYAGRGQARVVVRAPAAGRVLRIMEQSERTVAVGTPLLAIGDPSGLEIVVDVLSADAVDIRPGLPLLIGGLGGQTLLRGRVKYVEPAAFTKVSALGVEEQRVNVIATLDAVPANVGDGYRVDARFILRERTNVVKVPTSALFRDGEQWCVYAVVDGTAHRVPVQLGERNAFDAEVLGGLAVGAVVIVHPSDKVSDGVSAEPAAEAPAGA